MCQEVHIADIRTALLDYCEEDDVECAHVEDLLAEIQKPIEHAAGRRLSAAGSADRRHDRAK